MKSKGLFRNYNNCRGHPGLGGVYLGGSARSQPFVLLSVAKSCIINGLKALMLSNALYDTLTDENLMYKLLELKTNFKTRYFLSHWNVR